MKFHLILHERDPFTRETVTIISFHVNSTKDGRTILEQRVERTQERVKEERILLMIWRVRKEGNNNNGKEDSNSWRKGIITIIIRKLLVTRNDELNKKR